MPTLQGSKSMDLKKYFKKNSNFISHLLLKLLIDIIIIFIKAYHLLGQFLILKKDEEKFVNYLRKEIGVANNYSITAYKCLYEWSLNFI